MQQLLGNKRLLSQLRAAADENRLAHAYLLVGGEGSGKKTLASLMSYMILCQRGGCGSCTVCEKLEKNIHPDVIHVQGVTKSGAYSVDQIRELRKDALIYPNEAAKKVYILHHVEKMTPQAQDAFLKILDVPPEFVVFLLLCSDESKLLTTILSRVIRLAMEVPPTQESLVWLRSQCEAEEDVLQTALGISGGNPGKAKALLQAGVIQDYISDCEYFCTTLITGTAYDLCVFCHKLAEDRAAFAEFMGILGMYLRDILVYRITKGASQLIFAHSVQQNAACYSRMVTQNIPAVIDGLQQLAAGAGGALNMLLLEMRLVTLTRSKLIR